MREVQIVAVAVGLMLSLAGYTRVPNCAWRARTGKVRRRQAAKAMYPLMNIFHLPPLLKLISSRR